MTSLIIILVTIIGLYLIFGSINIKDAIVFIAYCFFLSQQQRILNLLSLNHNRARDFISYFAVVNLTIIIYFMGNGLLIHIVPLIIGIVIGMFVSFLEYIRLSKLKNNVMYKTNKYDRYKYILVLIAVLVVIGITVPEGFHSHALVFMFWAIYTFILGTIISLIKVEKQKGIIYLQSPQE